MFKQEQSEHQPKKKVTFIGLGKYIDELESTEEQSKPLERFNVLDSADSVAATYDTGEIFTQLDGELMQKNASIKLLRATFDSGEIFAKLDGELMQKCANIKLGD